MQEVPGIFRGWNDRESEAVSDGIILFCDSVFPPPLLSLLHHFLLFLLILNSSPLCAEIISDRLVGVVASAGRCVCCLPVWLQGCSQAGIANPLCYNSKQTQAYPTQHYSPPSSLFTLPLTPFPSSPSHVSCPPSPPPPPH